jgi:hypothetical protein
VIIRQLVVTSLISSSAGRPANSLGGTHRVGSVKRMIPSLVLLMNRTLSFI